MKLPTSDLLVLELETVTLVIFRSLDCLEFLLTLRYMFGVSWPALVFVLVSGSH